MDDLLKQNQFVTAKGSSQAAPPGLSDHAAHIRHTWRRDLAVPPGISRSRGLKCVLLPTSAQRARMAERLMTASSAASTTAGAAAPTASNRPYGALRSSSDDCDCDPKHGTYHSRTVLAHVVLPEGSGCRGRAARPATAALAWRKL